MKSRQLGKSFSIIVMASLLLSLLSPASALAFPIEQPAVQAVSAVEVEQEVEEAIASEGQTDFFIWMAEKADLSPAENLLTKEAKGQFVFDTLRETAERTQNDLRGYFDSQGIKYQSFYIANKILVYGGDAALLGFLTKRTDVEKITANHQYQLDEPFKDQPEAVESNIAYVNADDVWAMGFTGQGIVLAGNDTGLDETVSTVARHYRGCIDPPACTTWDHNYNWWDATGTYPTNPTDGHGHGTHTTGTMVGDDGGTNQIGMAPGAQTVHCKNMTDGGSGDDGTFIECFQWDLAPWDLTGSNPMPSMAPDAINNSWGYGGGNQPQFEDEIAALQTAGILVEVSAGNEGSTCGSLRSPGDYEGVLTTGSVSHEAGAFPGPITSSSSRGPSALYPDDFFPDIMAPGNSIRSQLPGGGFEYWGGTSMAGPHVTGLIGLLWSASPGLRGRVADTIQIIKDTAVPITGYVGSCGGDYVDGPNNDWGYGTIDALAAVQLAIAMGGAGTLGGTVTSSVGGAPVEGVNIHAEHEDGYIWQQLTTAAGEYEMIVATGEYVVTASKYGWIPETVNGVAVITDTLTTLNFVLDPAPMAVIDGYVTDALTGWPLYARIDIDGNPEGPVFTDPETGYYSVSLAEGTAYTFHVNAWTGGYIQENWTSPVIADPLTQDFELDVDVATCNAPGYEPSISYFEDFEMTNGGFTVDPGSINSTWAWGTPTSGPGNAYSGVNAWATNLAGNYPDYTDDWLISPVIDLSSLGSGFRLSWAQWLQTEGCCDHAYLDVSSDGGTTWATVYQAEGDVDLTWAEKSVNIDASYATAQFRVRYYLHSDLSIPYPGWYLDDVAVYGECLPITGGLVVGNVYDQNTSLPINGASVTADTGEDTVTVATPEDPEVDDGFYVLFVHNELAILNVPPNAKLGTSAPSGSVLSLSGTSSGQPTGPTSTRPEDVLWSQGTDYVRGGIADYFPAESWGAWSADDFYNDEPWSIDTIYTPGFMGLGSMTNAIAFHWCFYPNNGGVPAGDPSSGGEFLCYSTGVSDPGVTIGGTYGSDVTLDVIASAGTTIELPAGNWWFVFYPEFASSSVDWYYQCFGTTANSANAMLIDPANHFGAGFTTWTPWVNAGVTDYWDLAFVLDGTVNGSGVNHDITADAQYYSPDTETVDVPDWNVVTQDFYLGTGQLVFDPPSVAVAVEMGDTTSVIGTLSNIGTGETPYEFMEQDRGWTPMGYIEYLPMPEGASGDGAVYNGAISSTASTRQPYIFHGNAPYDANIIVYCDDDQHNPSPVEIALQSLGLTYTFYGDPNNSAPLDAWALDLNSGGWDLAILAQDSWGFYDGHEYDALLSHINNGGTAITYSWLSGIDALHMNHPLWAAMGAEFGAWLNSPANLYWWDDNNPLFEGVPEFTQLANLGYVAYGAKMTNIGAPETGIGGFTTDPAVGEDGVILTEEFKTLYRGLTDNLNSADQDSDGMPDAAEWWLNSIEFMLNPAVEVPWLSESPISGTIGAGVDIPVTIDFDATVLTQPGTYMANLNVKNDTPYGKLTIPITMTVTPPASYGKLDGTITSLGYCDDNPAPLKGAEVTITGDSGAIYVIETDVDGYFMLWLDSLDNPYTVSVADPEHVGEDVMGVVVPASGGLVTQNFDLRWLAACVSADPLLLEATLEMDETDTQVVTLSNDGAAGTPFEASESDQGYEPPMISIPRYAGAPIISTVPASIGPAPASAQPRTGASGAGLDQLLAGVPAFAIDVYPGYILGSFDTETPGDWTEIAPVPDTSQYFGGDFLNGDFSKMYIVDYGTNTLYTISTFDGLVSTIGPAVPNEDWTGLAGAPDGTLYGSATNCSASTLYTVDPDDGTTIVIGPVSNAPCLIDIAVNGDGEMYGIDIINDVLVQIDPATGAGTVIGSLGIDANYAQGMDFDEESGILYWAAYSSQGELRVIDTTTGNSALIGGFPGGGEVDCLAIATGGGGDVLWLSEVPVTGTLAADGTLDMDVIFDANAVTQPGDYFADLKIKTDDPTNSTAVVQAVLHAVAPAGWGGVEGTITDLGYCDENPVPAEGATVLMTLDTGITMTVETDASGHFEWWFPAADGPVDIEVTFDEHTSASMDDIAVVAGDTSVADMDLRLLAPCIHVSPVQITEQVGLGNSNTVRLQIVNSGAVGSTFELREQNLGYAALGQAAVPNAECIVGVTAGAEPEMTQLTNTLDELGYTWVLINTIQDAYDAEAAVVFDHSPAANLSAVDLQAWMEAGYGYIEQGDWPTYFPDQWLGATSGTPVDIVVADPTHELATGLPASWQGYGFWAYDWDQDAVGYIYDTSFPNIIQAGFSGSMNDRAVSYIEVGEDGRGVYLGINVQGTLAGANELQLLDNAIKWAGHCGSTDVVWLSEVPITGTVGADSYIEIDVTLSATDPITQTGTYLANLKLYTDDSVNGKLTIPVTMIVVEGFFLYMPYVAKP